MHIDTLHTARQGAEHDTYKEIGMIRVATPVFRKFRLNRDHWSGPGVALIMLLAQIAPSPAAAADNCTAMRFANFSQLPEAPTTITTATSVAASDELPGYCRIAGIVAPQVGFEVRLPTENWNGKYLMQGCGGLCGIIKIGAADDALARGYAVATSDLGHQGTPATGTWAYNNRPAEIDFGYRATHVATIAAEAIVKRFYGDAARFSFFRGCSTGGRQAMVEAQRFPQDFDGIIAGAPVINETGIGALHLVWSTRANLAPDGSPIMDGKQIPLLHDAVIQSCDPLDGTVDGIITDPRRCTFDPQELVCKGEPDQSCLTAAQAKVVQKLYSGPQDSTGKQLYPGGLMRGSEYEWTPALIGTDGQPALAMVMPLISDFLSYLAFAEDPGPGYSIMDFNFDTDPAKLAFMEAIYSGSNPDLRAFKNHGGKLILYQGWDDLEITPVNTVEYYELATNTMGGNEKTLDFFRLFMQPGVAHCRRGPGADAVDFLSALENWVEHDKSPEQLVAAHMKTPQAYDGLPPLRFPLNSDEIGFTRPLYPYPATARWSGTGDINEARNWGKVEPLK
jgi:hypothetical protein